MRFKRTLIVIIVVLLIYGINRWYDYREKNLAEILDANKVTAVYFNIRPFEEDKAFNRKIVNETSIKVLTEFFSLYTVKKTGSRNFLSKYPEEQFTFQLEYSDQRITVPNLIERDVALIGMDQYDIINEPIDYKWLEDYLAKHGQKF
ncbi:hypothetical protein [Cytobacillus oceanisediminis]|uniref:hypothetical protein n=1 Tax=Cytobacillus oceanisediminis TaxID=665099 RepID=UPI00119DC69B|nr:hypothetical protein [Cytobacillus oceanisediminis]